MKIIIKLRKTKAPEELKECVRLFDKIQAMAEVYPIIEEVDMK